MTDTAMMRKLYLRALEAELTPAEAGRLIDRSTGQASSVLYALYKRGKLSRRVCGQTPNSRLTYAYYRPNSSGFAMYAPVPAQGGTPAAPAQGGTPTPAAPAQGGTPAPAAPANTVQLLKSLEDMLESVADRLVENITVRVLNKLQTELTTKLKEIVPERKIAPCTEAFASNKPVLPRILVVGLLPQQAGFIAEEFSEAFDLRFWSLDDGYARLKTLVTYADDIIVLTTKISHKVTDTIKPRRYIPVGGMSAIRTVLTEKFCEQSKTCENT